MSDEERRPVRWSLVEEPEYVQPSIEPASPRLEETRFWAVLQDLGRRLAGIKLPRSLGTEGKKFLKEMWQGPKDSKGFASSLEGRIQRDKERVRRAWKEPVRRGRSPWVFHEPKKKDIKGIASSLEARIRKDKGKKPPR